MTLKNPVTEAQVPAAIARDSEVTEAVTQHANALDPHPQYLLDSEAAKFFARSLSHNTPPTNPDGYVTSLVSNDSNIDGIIKGWHFLTSLRGNDSSWGIQLAFCDTQNNIKYRRKVGGTWQAWVTIV
jgi:hypothetical protein